MMSKAMGRCLPNILFSRLRLDRHRLAARPSATTAAPCARAPPRTSACCSPTRSKVVIIPGYGLAVAQAQHVVRELADELESKGIEVFFAIHPVAGRMPGHMNVLLAEANVPYDELRRWTRRTPSCQTADVALVVGANDTVNPAATNDPASARSTACRSSTPTWPTTSCSSSARCGPASRASTTTCSTTPRPILVFGDAKDTLTKLVAAVKSS